MGISTHILDTARGVPARDVMVRLDYAATGNEFTFVREASTNTDGRVPALADHAAPGLYRLTFSVASYWRTQNVDAFFPEVQVQFRIPSGGATHYHVPLLLAPFGYSTYRGS